MALRKRPQDTESFKLVGGISIGGFDPDPTSCTFPDPTTEEGSYGLVDLTGHIVTRGPVFTDEGSFRDDFPGAALDATIWTSFGAGVGGSAIAVAASLLSITSGTTAAHVTGISRPIDLMPMNLMFQLALPARVAVTGANFFVGLSNDPDPAITGSQYVRYRFLNSQTNTQALCESSGHAGAGGTEGGPGNNVAVLNTTNADNAYQIAIDQPAAQFRQAAITVTTGFPPATLRSQRSLHIPTPYTPLYLVIGVTANGVTSQTMTMDVVVTVNSNRLKVDTTF